MMTANREAGIHLDHLRAALAQGMIYWVGGIVKAALIAGCTRGQVLEAASTVGPAAAEDRVRGALDEWSWLESRRKAVTAELNRPFGSGPIL